MLRCHGERDAGSPWPRCNHRRRGYARQVFGKAPDMHLIYDVSHNMAKNEEHVAKGR